MVLGIAQVMAEPLIAGLLKKCSMLAAAKATHMT
jgi:hypothetical protein